MADSWYQIKGRSYCLRWITESHREDKTKPLHKRLDYLAGGNTISGFNLSLAVPTLVGAIKVVRHFMKLKNHYEDGEILKFQGVGIASRMPITVAYLTNEKIIMFPPSTLLEYPNLPPQLMPNETYEFLGENPQ